MYQEMFAKELSAAVEKASKQEDQLAGKVSIEDFLTYPMFTSVLKIIAGKYPREQEGKIKELFTLLKSASSVVACHRRSLSSEY